MTKIYLRSVRSDGYYEGVEPEINQFNQPIHSLESYPVLHLIHPDLGKSNGIGWLVNDHQDGWEVYNSREWKQVPVDIWTGFHPDCRRRKIIVAKRVEAQANYHQVVPDSHYWDSIDSLINYLSYQKARAVDIDYLITGFKNSLKNGYDIRPSQPAENNGQEEGKEFCKWLTGEVATLAGEMAKSKAMNGMFDKVHLQILHKRLNEVLQKYQTASRQSDAVEFGKWLGKMFNGESQIKLPPGTTPFETLYDMFLQSKST